VIIPDLSFTPQIPERNKLEESQKKIVTHRKKSQKGPADITITKKKENHSKEGKTDQFYGQQIDKNSLLYPDSPMKKGIVIEHPEQKRPDYQSNTQIWEIVGKRI